MNQAEINPITPAERLLELQKKQTAGIGWTEADRIELLRLQNEKKGPLDITEEHKKALHRQNIAGQGKEPELTEEERRLIQEANRSR